MIRGRPRGPLLSLGLSFALFAGLALSPPQARASYTIYDGGGNATNLTSVTMEQLIDEGYYLRIDDKLFDNFHGWNAVATGGATAVDKSDIVITPIETSRGGPGTGPGLHYASTAWSVFAGQSQDTSFTYDVSVIGGAEILHDASLYLSGLGLGDPTSSIVINETLTSGPPSYNYIAAPQVYAINSPPPGGNVLFDEPFFTPVSFVQVTKDIALDMTDSTSGHTSFSVMEQRFSQLPEPSSMAIAGLGALGLIGYGIRRKRASA